jgi:N-acetylmuramoyl-L-alanine amidase
VKLRGEVLVGCGLAVLASLITASAIAAHSYLTAETSSDQQAPAEQVNEASTVNGSTQVGDQAASPPEKAAGNTSGQQVLPVPKEALPATKAREVQGNRSLPQHQPTPLPSRTTIILDPGHGRGDPGAVHHTASGEVDLTEADSNLAIAEHLRRFLEEKGYDVYVTRAGFGRPPADGPLTRLLITADLWARVQLAKAVDGDIFISLHSNGSTNPRQSGAEIWYCGEHQFGAQSSRLAQYLLDAAMQGLKDYGYDAVRRGTQEDSTVHQSDGFCQFLVTREVHTPAVLTELLFLTNDADAAVLKNDAAREAIARRIAEAIDQFAREQGDG